MAHLHARKSLLVGKKLSWKRSSYMSELSLTEQPPKSKARETELLPFLSQRDACLTLRLLYQLSLQPPSRAIVKTGPLHGMRKEWRGIFISVFKVSTSAMCSLSPPGHGAGLSRRQERGRVCAKEKLIETLSTNFRTS